MSYVRILLQEAKAFRARIETAFPELLMNGKQTIAQLTGLKVELSRIEKRVLELETLAVGHDDHMGIRQLNNAVRALRNKCP